jgi:pyruvate dehydrogenase E2 component (dihydrolipoamide acetyltransferase)
MTIRIVVPQIGEAIAELTIVEWHKHEGDHIKPGDVLFDVNSDKAIVEVDAFVEGTLTRILVPAGSPVMPQDVVALVEPVIAGAEIAPDDGLPGDGKHDRYVPRITPVARRMVEELGVEPAAITGTGPSQRIMSEDVRAFARQAQQPSPASVSGAQRPLASPKARRLARAQSIDLRGIVGTGVDNMIVARDVQSVAALPASSVHPDPASANGGDNSRIPLDKLRQTIAARTAASKQTVPHFYLMVDVEMTATQALRTYCRETLGWSRPPTYTDLMVRACGLVLRSMPAANASYAGGKLIRRSAINIGVAVSTDNGLLVPVLPNADSSGLREISEQVRELGERARRGRLTPGDVGSKSMVVSNLGMFGVDAFVAIIDLPDPMILAVGRISERVIPLDGQIVIRPMCTLTLSVDHRAMDGAQGAQFLQRLKAYLEQPFELLG